jgi:4-amino-4-deoxy-L-arabinose transferase-like glycosyltransferase
VDGAFYALSGSNLFMGNGLTYSDVPNTFLWPMFSILIGLVNLIVTDLQISSHIVLILSFTISIFPFYYLVKNLFNIQTAVIAVILYALNGFIIRLSGRLLAEMVLILMLITAFYFASKILKSIQEDSQAKGFDFILCGVFLGFSYLTKPEAFQFSVIVILFIMALIVHKKHFIGNRIKFALLVIAFVVTVAPQIYFVHEVTGKWVLTTYNRFLFRPAVEPFLGIDACAPAADPRMEYNYNAYIVRSPYTEESWSSDVSRLGTHFQKYAKSFFTIIGFVHLILFIASFFVLKKEFKLQQLFLYLLLIPSLTLILWYSTIDRHFMMFIPVFIILSSAVIWKINIQFQNQSKWRHLWIILLLLVFLQSFTPIANNSPTNRVINNHRRMGEWIRDHLPESKGKLFADRKPFITFLAQGRYYRINKPKDKEWLVSDLQNRNVDYLIVEQFMVDRYNHGIRELLEPKDWDGLKLIHVEDDPQLGKAILYQVEK